VDEASGVGTIETYTVVHARDGSPRFGVIYGRVEDGRRFVAHVAPDSYDALTESCQVGARVRLRHDARTHINHADLR